MRHVIKTIANLPDMMDQQISIVINDREFGVVARNTILLLLALTAQDITEMNETTISPDIVEGLIHLWYSALIPSSVQSQLQDRVKPLIEELCSRITNKPLNSVIGKTWEFSHGRTLRLVLLKRDWLQLLELLDLPKDITPEDAVRIRTRVTLAPARTDYRERWYFKDVSPFIRIAKQRFREDGLLLPFGYPREAFNIPNP